MESVVSYHSLGIVTYHACSLINAWKINFGNELDGRGRIWVGLAAVNIEAVNSIFMHTL